MLSKIKDKIIKNKTEDTSKKVSSSQKTSSTNNKEVKSKYNVLNFLNIEENIKVEGVITSNEVHNIEFDLTAPTGLDPKAVSRFCDKVEHSLFKYEKVLNDREKDFQKLLQEAKRIESLLQEEKEKGQMAAFMNEIENKEEIYKNKIINLQLENQELRKKIEDKQQEIEKIKNKKNDIKNKSWEKLPTFEEKEKDILDEI